MDITTIDLHDAEKQLVQLVQKVSRSGKPIVIAEDGKSLVQIAPLAEKNRKPIWGFMQGQITVPDDFDDMEAETIAAMFAGEDDEDSL
ncbi:MAG: hypothetical protein Q4D61_01730 [Cardiobacteriaceae bacterium]|nr:hypothetical protein [Cardiobacteriaceae bacterium]